MGVNEILALVGGLALFLLGMNSMGDGLEKVCGNKMKSILERLTSNRFLGVTVGMVITAIIQSSSATTVMVVGFVNAGMMTLTQAVWVIMGANIGTTITGQLVALDIGWIAPVFSIIGVIMIVFVKKPSINELGKIFCGFGVLFIGMDMMSGSMTGLRESEEFVSIMTNFSNPILGILAGLVFTAIIQSSSASVGILQALAISGVITLDSAVYVLFGQNIGTCVTALLASIGTSRAAKRTTMIHFSFNIIGTIMFTIICLTTPLVDFMKDLVDKPATQIANMHTLFNIVTTLVLLPFGQYLVKFAEKILPDKQEKKESIFMYLGNDVNMNVGGTAVHLENIRLEIDRMYNIAVDNINMSFDSLLNGLTDEAKINSQENLIDKLNEGITKEITACMAAESNQLVSESYGAFLTLTNNIERLSDHAMNIFEHALDFKKSNIEINPEVKEEIQNMKFICNKMIDSVFHEELYNKSESYENDIDDMTVLFRTNMMRRLSETVCTAEGSLIYSSILIDFERIGDHLLNIAESNLKLTNV
ncbi:MAG: Na/Pi cotransporter family protein [Acholeplasmatales bacterium]|nr:Na/Pi cotransporter family protein [Acholeplasmatales bacterium]